MQISGMMFSECIAHSPPASLSPPIRVHRLKDHELRVMLEVGFLRCESQILLPCGMSTTLAIHSGIYVTWDNGSRHFSCLQNVTLRKWNNFIANSIHRKSENFLVNIPTASGVPTIFFSEREGGSTNSVEDRGQRERGSGGGSPLVRDSEGSCNLVQEITFYIKIFLIFGTLYYLWWQPIYLSLLM
jgi:hypothetical protein